MLDVPALVVLIISRLPSLNFLVNMLHSSRTAQMRQNMSGALYVRQPEPAQAAQASRGRGRDVELQCRGCWAYAAYLFSYLNAHTREDTSTQVHSVMHDM